MSTSLIGKTIGHYRVLDELGTGGMGVVYRAQDLTLGRQVALKVLTTDAASSEDSLERFRREARTASSLNHPNICTVYGFDEQDGRGYLAMELLEGESLDQRLGDEGLPLVDLLDISVQMADALDAAHAEGVLHRDIKPANIFITKRGQVKILDFGLAKLTAHMRTGASHDSRAGIHSTVVGTTVGTVAYMSPEQARGEPLDPRSDLFSLGVVLYEMATGQQGFPGHTTAVVFDGILNRDPVPPSSVNPAMPPAVDRIVAKALEKDRDRRYQTAADIRADVQQLRRDTGSQRVAVVPVTGSASAATVGRPYGSAPASSGAASTLFRAEAGPEPAMSSATPGESDSHAGSLASRAASALQVPWILAGAGLAVLVVVGATLVMRPANAPAGTAGVAPIPVTERPPAIDAHAGLPPSGPEPSAQPPSSPTASNVANGPAASPAPVDVSPSPAAAREAEAAQRLDIGRAKLANGLLDQGVADLRQIALDYPTLATTADALLLAAESLESAGRADDAMAVYVEFESRFRAHERLADSRLHRALLLRQARQPERQMEGYTLLGEVAHAYPGTPQAHEALQARRQIEQQQRRQLRAEDPVLHAEVPALLVTLRMLADQFPDDPQSMLALNQLASGYQDLNQYEAAAETWERMARQFPGNPMEVWFRLGEFYERRLRDTARARTAYGNVPPESPRYREAQQRLKRL